MRVSKRERELRKQIERKKKEWNYSGELCK